MTQHSTDELDRTRLGRLIAEISKFGGAYKGDASRLARILLPHIESYARQPRRSDTTLPRFLLRLSKPSFNASPGEFVFSMDELVEALSSLLHQKELEARIDEVSRIVIGKDSLNDVYGNDHRNNYGYNETQVRDAANYLRGKHSVRLAQLNKEREGM